MRKIVQKMYIVGKGERKRNTQIRRKEIEISINAMKPTDQYAQDIMKSVPIFFL